MEIEEESSIVMVNVKKYISSHFQNFLRSAQMLIRKSPKNESGCDGSNLRSDKSGSRNRDKEN